MQFSTKAAALQPHQEGALLYICRNRENAPDNETARLLLESLAEGERFAAAQTAEAGKLKAVAVALPENDGYLLEYAAVAGKVKDAFTNTDAKGSGSARYKNEEALLKVKTESGNINITRSPSSAR